MSRNVEVLRQMRAELIGPQPTDKWRAETDALSDAISALEEKEATCIITDHAYQPHPPDPRFCGCSVARELHASERPTSAMEERVPARDDLLYRVLAAAGVAGTNAFSAIKACGDIVTMINAALHPHQSWCRGDHSEGACPAPGPMEID
jgi:hypothetical protein